MTEREEIVQQIIEWESRKRDLARDALLAAADGNLDLCEHLDLLWEDASDEIGQLKAQLWGEDDYSVLREHLGDVAYGRML